MIEQIFPFQPLDVKCHQPPTDLTSVPSTCGGSNAHSATTITHSSTQLQQPLSSTTSNIPHTPNTPASVAGNIIGNLNNNCSNTFAIQHPHQHPIVGHPSMAASHHHHHHHHGAHHHLHHHHTHHIHHPSLLLSSSSSPRTTGGSAATRTPSMSAVMLAALCGSCCGPISDRYIMRVVDAFYHEDCLQCTSCSVQLMHSCFARNGKLYCRLDYERLFMKNRCLGCGERIGSDELVMRTSDNVFHLKCFSCVVCGIQLQKGEQYVVKQSQLFCRSDYEKEVEMLQGFNDFVDDYFSEDVFPSKVDGRRGPKRPRTILNTQQRRAFKASFDVSPKPCRKVRETLAKETGLSLRIVQVWFQNQRAKVKKIQKKARQDHHRTSTNKSCSESESLGESSLENETKIKDENESDTESYINGNLDPEKSIIKEEQDNDDDCYKKAMLISSTLGYKDMEHHHHHHMAATGGGICGPGGGDGAGGGGVLGVAGDGLHLSTIMGLTYSAFQQLMSTPNSTSSHLGAGDGSSGGGLAVAASLATHPAHILNPIDRLYSMQNAYFRCDEAKFQGNDDSMGNG